MAFEEFGEEFYESIKTDVLQIIEGDIRAQVEKGNGGAILPGIVICLHSNVMPPDWLRDAFVKAYFRVKSGDAANWAEVFGRAHKKGHHLNAIRKREIKAPAIWIDIYKASSQDGRAIDEALFEEVGKRHGIGKTLAADYYYAFKSKAEKVVADSKADSEEVSQFPDESMIYALAINLSSAALGTKGVLIPED